MKFENKNGFTIWTRHQAQKHLMLRHPYRTDEVMNFVVFLGGGGVSEDISVAVKTEH